MKTGFTISCVLLLAVLGSVKGDEQTREVQEQLRKRHLFYGDVNGQFTPELSEALKRYQGRKNFPVTGTPDDVTLRSLGINSPEPPAEGDDMPDVPVLKSDVAVKRQPAIAPSPAPGAAMKQGSTASPQEIRNFLRAYFTACQSGDVNDELAFYADSIRYFDNGLVDRNYVRNELLAYDQHWPERQYQLGSSVRTWKSGDNARASCQIAFAVQNPRLNRQAHGRLNNSFVLARRPDSQLAIVEIHESRIPSSRHRANPVAGAARRFSAALRSILR
jgi:peptidoglycan hydrolase-like protein with peptidoglycan-binding domain